jgi:tetratricopeptide (TPR) repeat protein
MNKLVKDGNILLSEGEFELAAGKFDEAIINNPDDADAYWGMLLCELKCREARKLGIYSSDLIKSNSYFRMAQKLAGDSLANTIAKVADEFAANDLKIANRALEDGDFSKAEDNFRLVIAAEPRNPHAHIGSVLASLGMSEVEELRSQGSRLKNIDGFEQALEYADGELRSKLTALMGNMTTNDIVEKAREESQKGIEFYERAAIMLEGIKDYPKAVVLLENMKDKIQSEANRVLTLDKSRENIILRYETSKLLKQNNEFGGADVCAHSLHKQANGFVDEIIEEIGKKSRKPTVAALTAALEEIQPFVPYYATAEEYSETVAAKRKSLRGQIRAARAAKNTAFPIAILFLHITALPIFVNAAMLIAAVVLSFGFYLGCIPFKSKIRKGESAKKWSLLYIGYLLAFPWIAPVTGMITERGRGWVWFDLVFMGLVWISAIAEKLLGIWILKKEKQA